jgi:thiol-disulfide isomerase/thioredoxin
VTRLGRFRCLFVALVALHVVALGIQVWREGRLDENPLGLRVERLVTGRSESLAQVADGRPLLLVFWTTWCEYCAEELEGGGDLARRLSAGSAPVGVMFVNVREHGSAVANHPAIEDLASLVGLDRTGEVARAFGVGGYPSRVLLGSGGEVLWFAEGLDTSVEFEVSTRVGRHGGDH